VHNLRLKFFLHQLEGGGLGPLGPPSGYAYDHSDDCIQEIFCSSILSKLMYLCPVWSGFCSTSDVNKLDRFIIY